MTCSGCSPREDCALAGYILPADARPMQQMMRGPVFFLVGTASDYTNIHKERTRWQQQQQPAKRRTWLFADCAELPARSRSDSAALVGRRPAIFHASYSSTHRPHYVLSYKEFS